jgi:hypothetical protein
LGVLGEKISSVYGVWLLLMQLQVGAIFYFEREMSAYIEVLNVWLQLSPYQ